MATPFSPASTHFAYDGTMGVDLAAVVTGTGTSFDQGDDFTLGQCVKSANGNMYMRCHAAAALPIFSFVAVTENFEAALLTKALADDGHFIGATQVAVADNEFFWLACTGSDIGGLVLVSCAADVIVYTTATPGAIDDTSTSQTILEGLRVVTAEPGTGTDAEEIIISGGGIHAPVAG